MSFEQFYKARSLADALEKYHSCPNGAQYVAGGTDVMVTIREKDIYKGKTTIDISDLKELQGMEFDGETVILGAGCTHRAVTESPLVKEHLPLLAEACLTVGSPQIRNRGTLGGNLGNASPAADSFGPMVLYGGEAVLLSREGRKTVPVTELITGPYRNALRPGDLIEKVILHPLSGYKQRFYKLGRREALAISRLTVSIACKLSDEGDLEDLRISLGSAFPRPMVFADLLQEGACRKPNAPMLREIAVAAAAKLPEIAGVRPTTEYKQTASENLIYRMLCEICEVKTDG